MELGSTVTLTYKGTLDDGTVFGYADKDNPMKFQTGMDMVIDGLEKAILEMNEVGEKKTFTVDEYEGYGEYLDGYTAKVPRHQIPAQNLHVGKRIWMANSQEGDPTPATVIAIEPGEVTFDLNHPLAGKKLTFEVEILEIEEAPENFVSAVTKEEHLKEQSKLLGGNQADSFR